MVSKGGASFALKQSHSSMLDLESALRRGSSLGDWALREALAMNDVAAAWQRTEAAHGMPTDDAVATGGICTQSSSNGMSISVTVAVG